MVHGGRDLVPRPGLYSRDLCTPQKKSMGQLGDIRRHPGRNTLETYIKKTLGHSLVNTATAGWLDHSTAGAGGLEEATAGCGPSDRGRRVGFPREPEGAADGGLAFPMDGGVISREWRGR